MFEFEGHVVAEIPGAARSSEWATDVHSTRWVSRMRRQRTDVLPHTPRMSVGEPPEIYEHDPSAAPDEDFERGTLAHLRPGNKGRMLDPRRTPVRVLALDESDATFALRVEGFEDRGACWRLPVEDVEGFQFEPGGGRLEPEHVGRLAQMAERYARPLEIEVEEVARAETELALIAERERLRPRLASVPGLAALDLPALAREREGSPLAATALAELLAAAGLDALEHEFAATYVSNPASGEVVKGHAIVLAEIGLCPYHGRPVRGSALFTGTGSREARRAHILLRLAFLAELFGLLDLSRVELFRGVATDRLVSRSHPPSLLAATFSREVALAHLASPTRLRMLARQHVPTSRVLMSFIETREMSERYREAEAVLIGDPANTLF